MTAVRCSFVTTKSTKYSLIICCTYNKKKYVQLIGLINIMHNLFDAARPERSSNLVFISNKQ